jgi:hypothetical protein
MIYSFPHLILLVHILRIFRGASLATIFSKFLILFYIHYMFWPLWAILRRNIQLLNHKKLLCLQRIRCWCYTQNKKSCTFVYSYHFVHTTGLVIVIGICLVTCCKQLYVWLTLTILHRVWSIRVWEWRQHCVPLWVHHTEVSHLLSWLSQEITHKFQHFKGVWPLGTLNGRHCYKVPITL